MEQSGFHKWLEDIEVCHVFDTHEAKARVLGLRWVATRRRTCHGGEGSEDLRDIFVCRRNILRGLICVCLW